MLEGHTRDVLCLDVQKEAAFSGKDGKIIIMMVTFIALLVIFMKMMSHHVICLLNFHALSSSEDDNA